MAQMQRFTTHSSPGLWPLLAIAASAWMGLAGCGTRSEPPSAGYVPLARVEAIYGPLITAGNHPTPVQNGTGERVGLFRDAGGTIWGLPLTIEGDAILACAPPALRDAPITDGFPEGSTVVGAANEPTGWREGTGRLELVLRDVQGGIHLHAVMGGDLPAAPVCQAPRLPGPAQQLGYYRLVPKTP